MRDNRGITLIELIIAIAAMGIVTAGVVGFLHVSLRTYGTTNRDIDLQYEAQLVTNQMKDLLIDANSAVKCTDTTDASGLTIRTLSIYNQVTSDKGTITEIRWEEASKKIYYMQYEYAISSTPSTPVLIEDSSLMAEYVTDFEIDLSSLPANKVLFTLSYEIQDRKYTGQSTINLRNNIRELVQTEDADDAFAGSADFTGSTITSVTVDPKNVTVRTNRDFTFTAEVHGMNSPSQDVIWSVEGNNSSATTIDSNGKLIVAVDETATTIKVVATSRYSTDVSGYVTVTVDSSPKVNAITIEKDKEVVERNETANFKAKVSAEEGANTNVVWSVSGEGAGSASISSSGVLTIGSDTTANTLTITATSVADNTIKGTTTIEVAQIKKFTIKGDGTLKQGSTAKYEVEVSSTTGSMINGAKEVTWSVVAASGYDVRVSQDGRLFVGTSVPVGATIELKATSKYDSGIFACKTVTVEARASIIGFIVSGAQEIMKPISYGGYKTQSYTYTVNITSSDGIVSDEMKGVTWSCSTLPRNVAFDTSTGTLTVSNYSNVDANGMVVRITAVSNYDGQEAYIDVKIRSPY